MRKKGATTMAPAPTDGGYREQQQWRQHPLPAIGGGGTNPTRQRRIWGKTEAEVLKSNSIRAGKNPLCLQACPPQGVRPKTDRTEHGTEPIEPKPSAPTNQPGSTTRCDTYIDRTEPTKCRRSRVSTEPIEPNISTFRISIEPIADNLGL